VALKSRKLKAKGRLLPPHETAAEGPPDDDLDVYDFPIVDIPPDFWTMKGIDFTASAARNGHIRYCHIHCRTEEVLAIFPGEDWKPVPGVEKIGASYRIEAAGSQRSRIERSRIILHRGRPPYPWDAFHVEVAALIEQGNLPHKKEAAILYFQGWFQKELNVEPSRAAIGEKLKPYYDRLIWTKDRK